MAKKWRVQLLRTENVKVALKKIKGQNLNEILWIWMDRTKFGKQLKANYKFAINWVLIALNYLLSNNLRKKTYAIINWTSSIKVSCLQPFTSWHIVWRFTMMVENKAVTDFLKFKLNWTLMQKSCETDLKTKKKEKNPDKIPLHTCFFWYLFWYSTESNNANIACYSKLKMKQITFN